MSYKRSRANFEDDHPHAPFAVFGTPLPDEADARDDGSYLPLWKQEVRDERGRKRLHGAFTGGWSAGYFNTVGSKEGWTPSTFVSSRNNRHKPDANAQQRPEDYMDEEDINDAAEAQQLQTTQSFAGLGSALDGENRESGLMGLFRASGDTMGLKLMRRMGWKDGQGVGPKIRRGARLDVGQDTKDTQTHLFAPDNAPMISLVRKTDRKGIGHDGEQKLLSLGAHEKGEDSDDNDNDDHAEEDIGTTLFSGRKKIAKSKGKGFGVGVLNDNGSDEEDPYEIGPKIKYNRVIGGDKKKKKAAKKTSSANPALRNAPVFVPKTARGGKSFRRCHDGRLPIDGFVLAEIAHDISNMFLQYAPPAVPPGWKSSKAVSADAREGAFVSAADAAKASTLDPRSRAALLGEKALPGKSVFDFMSADARDKLAAASGKTDLPQGKGEVPAEYALSDEDKQAALLRRIPKLDKETAAAALARSISGPYADNEARRARYRTYLEHFVGSQMPMPQKETGTSDEAFLKEMTEYYNCARIFKPMTSFMASRFTTTKSTTLPTASSGTGDTELLMPPEPTSKDPAEEAARMGLFGQMTRSTERFYPTRLLCKRFNVKAPAHAQPDGEASATKRTGPDDVTTTGRTEKPPAGEVKALPAPPMPQSQEEERKNSTAVDPERNGAVEQQAAHADVLKAIFGDSDNIGSRLKGPSRAGDLREAVEAFIGSTPEPRSKRLKKRGFPAVAQRSRVCVGASQGLRSGSGSSTALATNHRPELHRDPFPLLVAFDGPSPLIPRNTVKLSASRDHESGPPASTEERVVTAHASAAAIYTDDDAGDTCSRPNHHRRHLDEEESLPSSREQSPPPQYPVSEASASARYPPPFSSLFAAVDGQDRRHSSLAKFSLPDVTACGESSATAAAPPYEPDQAAERAFYDPVAETKRALPRDNKGDRKEDDNAEPPPAYSEGDSPLLTFTYLMAAAGGASSIITQVQQGGPPINSIGDVGADETIAMDLRGTRFVLSRDELLTLPEFVLLSLFPNGLFPEGHMSGLSEGDAVQVDYDPASLQYMLDFFRNVAQTIPDSSPSTSQDGDVVPLEPLASRDDSSKRAGIIVLREDLDFYAIPPRADISQAEMLEVKRSAALALQRQAGIFSGLKRSDEPGTTEAHLIEMLTAGGFNHDDKWGHRAGEPNKAVICSLALARLRSDIRGNDMGNNAVGMAQKLLLFWRKPARRCWWEGIELEGIEGVEGKLKVWIRRVWTLEMSVIGLR